MMRDFHFGFKLPFDTPENQEDSEDMLTWMLGINCRCNLQHLRKNPDTPLLYDSGIVYTPPDQADGRPPLKRGDVRALLKLLRKMGADEWTALAVLRMLKGIEIFLDIPTLLARGKGDCNELVPMRVAECWLAGSPASPHLIKERNDRGGWTYHAIVKHADGSPEDPSAILGMGGRANAINRAEECRKNFERWSNLVVAGKQLIRNEGANPDDVARRIAQMGLIPSDGEFKSPYPYVDEGGRRAA